MKEGESENPVEREIPPGWVGEKALIRELTFAPEVTAKGKGWQVERIVTENIDISQIEARGETKWVSQNERYVSPKVAEVIRKIVLGA